MLWHGPLDLLTAPETRWCYPEQSLQLPPYPNLCCLYFVFEITACPWATQKSSQQLWTSRLRARTLSDSLSRRTRRVWWHKARPETETSWHFASWPAKVTAGPWPWCCWLGLQTGLIVETWKGCEHLIPVFKWHNKNWPKNGGQMAEKHVAAKTMSPKNHESHGLFLGSLPFVSKSVSSKWHWTITGYHGKWRSSLRRMFSTDKGFSHVVLGRICQKTVKLNAGRHKSLKLPSFKLGRSHFNSRNRPSNPDHHGDQQLSFDNSMVTIASIRLRSTSCWLRVYLMKVNILSQLILYHYSSFMNHSGFIYLFQHLESHYLPCKSSNKSHIWQLPAGWIPLGWPQRKALPTQSGWTHRSNPTIRSYLRAADST